MKIFHVVAKSHVGTDAKHDINFHWPDLLFLSYLPYTDVNMIVYFQSANKLFLLLLYHYVNSVCII